MVSHRVGDKDHAPSRRRCPRVTTVAASVLAVQKNVPVMFFTVCSRSQQSFNDCVLSDSNQPEAATLEVLSAAIGDEPDSKANTFYQPISGRRMDNGRPHYCACEYDMRIAKSRELDARKRCSRRLLSTIRGSI